MSDSIASESETQAPNAGELQFIEGARPVRLLRVGSQTEVAEWLLGVRGDVTAPDFGVLKNTAFAGGQLLTLDAESLLWRPLTDSKLFELVAAFDGAQYADPQGKLRQVQIGTRWADSVRVALERVTHAPGFFEHAPHGLAFRNGFLRIAKDGGCRLEELTKEHHCTRALHFDYIEVPSAESFQHWAAFLSSVWPGDYESVLLCHQMIGYLLSGDLSKQKMFLMLGPPRAGKGIISHVLNSILGPAMQPFRVNGLDGPFAMAGLLGASVLVDTDFRRGKGSRDEGKQVERLLSISSGDVQNIPRKFKEDVKAILPGRIVIIANPPFGIRDVGAALASRMVILPFETSFLGKEDLGLRARLEGELPAIVALAMQSLKALRAQGRFIEPKSAFEYREEVELGQNPLKEFFDDWCHFGAGLECSCEDLYAAMRQWAEQNGNAPPSNQSFAAALKQLGVHKIRVGSDGARRNVYRGVGLERSAAMSAADRARGLRAPTGGIATVIPIRPPGPVPDAT